MFATSDAVGIALTVVLNLLLVGSLALFTYLLFTIVLRTQHQLERLLRGAALFVGAVIVLGAESAGISYADLILRALSNSKPVSFGLLGVVAPSAAGAAVGWYMIRAIKRNTDIAVRVLAFVGMLTATQFLTMYGVSLQEKGFKLGAAAIPNICFVAGVFLYVIFNLETTQTSRPERQSGMARWLMNAVKDRRGGSAEPTATGFAPTQPTGANVPPVVDIRADHAADTRLPSPGAWS